MALYTDRAHWAFHTPEGEGPGRQDAAHAGRPRAGALGIEHIPAYSPQARGRSERLNRTFQDRLGQRAAGRGHHDARGGQSRISRDTFLPQHNATFARRPARSRERLRARSARVDLDPILCHEEERVVARDNTVDLRRPGAADRARSRAAAAVSGLTVTVRQHLDGRYTITRGPHPLGHLSRRRPAYGRCRAVDATTRAHKPLGPPAQNAAGPQAPTGVTLTKADRSLSNRSGQITCQQHLSSNPLVSAALLDTKSGSAAYYKYQEHKVATIATTAPSTTSMR